MADADTNRLFEVIGELRGMLQSLLARTESIETETRRAVDGAHARMDKMDEKIAEHERRCQGNCATLSQRLSQVEAGQNIAKGGLIASKNATVLGWTLLTGAASLLAWFVSSGFFARS